MEHTSESSSRFGRYSGILGEHHWSRFPLQGKQENQRHGQHDYAVTLINAEERTAFAQHALVAPPQRIVKSVECDTCKVYKRNVSVTLYTDGL